MLLSLTPPAPLPTILFTLTFPSPLSESLPLPLAWDSHLQIVNNLRIAAPPDVHALDRSVAWVSLIDTVNFDLSTLTLTCTFIDHSKEEWPLSTSCVDLLETVISDVNRSAREAGSETGVRAQMGSPSGSNNSVASESLHPQRQGSASSSPPVSPTNSSLDADGGTGDNAAKTPKPKKRRSILAALVASLVPLQSSRNTTRPPSPNSQLPLSPSGGSLKSSSMMVSSPSQFRHEVSSEPEIITPPPGVPLSRYLRRRARSTLVDAFRRFVLSELGSRYRSETLRVNPHVNIPLGGPFYALWATRSMMRSVETEMGRVLTGCHRGNDPTSSACSSPLETPVSPGDLLDDCTTTDESSVHSIVDQTGPNPPHGNIKSPSSPFIPSKMRRKISPALSAEAYDTYTNLRETYIRLRGLSSQLEAHVQAENYIECVGSGPTSGISVDEEMSLDEPFGDIFNPDSRSSLASRSQAQEQLTSAEIKSRRRAWSTRMYLVSGWETYRSGPSQRVSSCSGLFGHKRSLSEPTPSLRGGAPMNLIGLSMPARPSPLSQTWVREPEQDHLDDPDVEDEGVYISSGERFETKWSRSFESGIGIGRRRESPSQSPISNSGHRRERCMSLAAPSRKTKLKPKVKAVPSPRSVYGYEDEYGGVGSGMNSRLRVRIDVDVSIVDQEAEMNMNSDGMDSGDTESFESDVDVDVCEVDLESEASNAYNLETGMEKLCISDGGTRSHSERAITNPSGGRFCVQDVEGDRAAISCPSTDPITNGSMDDHFDFHSYASHYPFTQPRAHSSRALKHFRYDYASDFLPAAELQNDEFGQDDDELYEDGTGTGLDYEYEYSRSRRADKEKGADDDVMGSGLYKKPSMEEFILPHPRSRADSGLDVVHVPIVNNVFV